MDSFLSRVQVHERYLVECFRDGKRLWAESIDNLVVTTGLNEILDKAFRGIAYTAAHYVGLKGAGAAAAGDTMAAHAGWAEDQNYDEAVRQALVWNGAAAGGSITNSVAKCVFTISGVTTIAGAFVTTSSVKGGAAGVLIGAGDFAAPRAVVDNDVLNVTVTVTLTAS